MANEKRLINANARIEEIKKAQCTGCENYGGIRCRACWVDDAIGLIDDSPTVDAVEVVHGRWLKLSPWNNHTQSCLCLNCDSISYQKKSGVYIGKIPNYCPNCGAKMDGDGNG